MIKKKKKYYNIIKFSGITSKLEHLKELGIGATWLSPIFQSPMYDFGYDIADFYSIHSEYGTMEDFERLIQKANELGNFCSCYLLGCSLGRIIFNWANMGKQISI